MNARKLTAMILGAAFLFGASTAPIAAMAQTHPEQLPTPGDPPSAEVSETELRAYADATVRLQEINKTYVERLEKAPDADAERQLRLEGQQEMAEAVKESGLSVERFSETSRTVQEDPALREKVMAYIKQKE